MTLVTYDTDDWCFYVDENLWPICGVFKWSEEHRPGTTKTLLYSEWKRQISAFAPLEMMGN